MRAIVLLLLMCSSAYAQTSEELVASAGKFMAANEYLRAIETFSAIPDTAPPRHRLDKHTGLALALINLGRFAEVPDQLARGQKMAEEIGGPAALARVEHMEGHYLSRTRRGDRGMGAFQRAVDLATKAGDNRLLASIYGNLSTAYQRLEDWERAIYFSNKSFDLIEHPSETNRFSHAMDQGIAQFELYERDAAEAQYRQALDLATRMGAKRNESFARGELAYLYWTFDHDAPKALDLYARAISLAEEARIPDLLATWFLDRGNVFRDTGQYEPALADYRKSMAIEEAAGVGRNIFPDRKNIGQVYRLMGKPRDAIAVLEPLIKDRAGDASPRHLWQAHMELASAYQAIGDRARAGAEFAAMMTTLEEQRNTAILDAFRTGSFAHALSAYDPYERYINFLSSDLDRRTDEALGVAERARARGFLESLASVRSSVAAKLPAPLLEQEAQIGRTITAVQEQLRASDKPKVERERLLSELERAERRRDDFILAMRVEHPALAEARYPEILQPSGVQATLRDGETAIVFFLGEPASFRWVVTRDRIDFMRLTGRAAIEQQAVKVRQLLRAPTDLDDVRRETAALAALLFDKLRVEGDGPLVIVPHGVLHYIPFEALPLDGRTIVERHAVTYVPSLNSLAHLRRKPRQATPFRLLAVGNPSMPPGRAESTRAGDVDNLALLGPLPYAQQELDAIRQMFWGRTEVLSGVAARESTIRGEALDRFPVIHFATHGLVSDAHPKRSGLLLSPEPGDDGLLQMGEIYGLGLRADLVVLSACQTALGRDVTGEGIVGLTRAFFYAGARSVVAALWNLNDRFTAEFVERFYREIGAGHPPDEALRLAKVAYVHHPQYGHPFYWSSLVLTGDGSHSLSTGPLGQPLWPKILAVLLTLAAILIATRSRGPFWAK